MTDLKLILDSANDEKRAEICRVIESTIEAGAPVAVLKEKLKEYEPVQVAV